MPTPPLPAGLLHGLVLLASLAPAGQPAEPGTPADPAAIVVLAEPRLPSYGAPAGVSPDALVQRLGDLGITARTRTAEEVSGGALATAAVFITLHGNTYPRPIEDALHAFHQRGGSIVSTGVPFTHPCEPARSGWRDTGHDAAFLHTLALGRFAGPALTRAGLTVSDTGRRVGLDQFDWPRLAPVEAQFLDHAALPPSVDCAPLLSIPGPPASPRPVAALLRRPAGGPDAWALTLSLHDEGGADRDPHYIEIVARAVALVCAERGLRDLDADPLPPVPAPLRSFAPPADLSAVPSTPRPSFEDIYPNADGIAETLLVADARAWPAEERLLARSIQGLANRATARVWLHQKGEDPFWLDWLVQRGDVQRTEPLPSLPALLERFPPAGVVVYDPRQPHTLNIATMIAAVEDLAVASPAVARRYDLSISQDLRGRFASNAEACAWAFETLWPRMSPRVIACVNPSPDILLHDYLVSQRVFCFWISGWVDGRQPGASRSAERALLAELLQRMPVNIPVLGYPYAGEGIGIQERPGVNLFSRTGKFLVPSDYQPNLSVLSATRPTERWRQPPPRAIPLDAGRAYVALTMSDGDNLNTLYDWFLADWRAAHHGDVAVGWTLGPSAADYYPAVVDWYYRQMSDRDHFQCAVSGIGYIYPDHYATAFTDGPQVRAQYWDLTDAAMARLDQRTLWLMGASGETLDRIATGLPTAVALFSGYGRLTGVTRDNAIGSAAGKPVFHVLAEGAPGALARDLVQAVGPDRPAFAHAFLFNWSWRLDDVARLAEALPQDYTLLRPDELATLYQRWREKSAEETGP